MADQEKEQALENATDAPEKPKSLIEKITAWLTSVQALIAAAAAVIGAIILLQQNFTQIFPDQAPDGGGEESTVAESRDSKATVSPCWGVEVKMPETVPFALRNSMFNNKEAVQRDFSWIEVYIENNCDHPLQLALKTSFSRKPSSAPPIKPIVDQDQFVVQPNDEKFKKIHPDITIQGPFDDPISLTTEWSLYRTKGSAGVGEQLDDGLEQTRILPENQFVWQLGSPYNEEVKKEFLFASLAAWTSDLELPVKKVIEAVDSSMSDHAVSGASDPHAYTAELVREALGQLAAIPDTSFTKRLGGFEPENTRPRTIDTPRQILQGESDSNDVELALTLAAVVKRKFQDIEIEPIMILFRDRVYFGWRFRDDTWDGIDLTAVLAQIVEDGTAIPVIASVNVETLIDSGSPGLFAIFDRAFELDGKGVYLDQEHDLFALGFLKGSEHFGIYSMR